MPLLQDKILIQIYLINSIHEKNVVKEKIPFKNNTSSSPGHKKQILYGRSLERVIK